MPQDSCQLLVPDKSSKLSPGQSRHGRLLFLSMSVALDNACVYQFSSGFEYEYSTEKSPTKYMYDANLIHGVPRVICPSVKRLNLCSRCLGLAVNVRADAEIKPGRNATNCSNARRIHATNREIRST